MAGSIGGVALKAALEKQMADLICIKHTRLCLGKCVNQINRDLKIAYGYWVMTDQCELTDDEINCIVNELRTVCNFQITQNTTPVPPNQPPLVNPTSPVDTNDGETTEDTGIVYTSATAFSYQDSIEWVQNIGGVRATSDQVYTVNSLIINGQEFITAGSEPTIVMPYTGTDTDGFDDGINWVAATNYEGKTYTNFVDGLNSIFATFGISVIKAQVMTKDQGIVSFGLYDDEGNPTGGFDELGNPISRINQGAFFILKTTDVIEWTMEISEAGGGNTRAYSPDLHSPSWDGNNAYSVKNYSEYTYPNNPPSPPHANPGSSYWRWNDDNFGRSHVDYAWWGTTDQLGNPWTIVNNLVVE